MTVRITTFYNNRQFLSNNSGSREEQSLVLERLSTLKRVNRGSDDPGNYLRIKEAKIALSETNAFQGNIQAVLQEFSVIETAFDGIRESLEKAEEVTFQGTSFLYDDLERETIADELQQLRLNIINRLNTQHEGAYLFSGTTTNTRPFQSAATGAYSGNTATNQVRISATDTVTTNFHGEEIAFGTTGQGGSEDILDLLADLETAFRNNDVTTVNNEIPRFAPALARINGLIGEVGTRSVRLISEQTHYDEFEEALRATLSELEDADLAEEAVNLETVNTTIDAQLRSQGSINRLNLLDLIG